MKIRMTLRALVSLSVITVAILAGGFVLPQDIRTLSVGAAVPNFNLKDINGKVHSLPDYRGKIVFIHFWSIVCPAVKQTEPKCKTLQQEFESKGVVQIAINANQRELSAAGDMPYANLRDHVEKAGVNFLVTVDPGNKITDILGAKSTPHCFVIDKDGVLRYSGALDDDPKGTKGKEATPYVRNAIEELLAGKEVSVKTTQPYG